MKINRILSAVLCVVIIAALSIPAAFAADVDTAANHDYGKEAYDFLKAVGIVAADDPAYSAAEPVSRAYFVKLALMLSNDAPTVLVSEGDVFFDVTKGSEYEAYIETAYRIGYISGGANGYFNPNDTVTYAQAVKILMNILGYTPVAEAKGGFPTGYITEAGSIGLLDDISIPEDGLLCQSQVMLLLRNAADADMMQVGAIGDPMDYYVTRGETILTQKHKIKTLEALIEANEYTDLLAQDSGLDRGTILAGGKILTSGDSGAADLLGYVSKLYYDESFSNTAPTVLYAKAGEDNAVWSCNNPKDLEVSGTDISYHTDETTTKKLKVSSGATYILNGKMAVYDINDLPHVYGSVTFISNDGDNIIDVVIVNDYATYIVSGVSVASKMINTKDGSRIELDEENEDYKFSVSYADGEEAVFKDIKEDTVILMAQTIGDGLHKKELIISNDVLIGVLSEIGSDYVTVDGASYSIDSSCIDRVKAGATYKYLLDAKGKIAYVYVENDVVYGYVYGAAKETGLNGRVVCRIFTENNRWVELGFKDKFKFNGTVIKAEDVLNAENLGATFDVQRQMVRYNVNADAEIIMMETAKTVLIDSANEDAAIESDTFRISYKPTGSVSYRSNPKSFDGNVFVDAAAKIFVVPDNFNRDDFRVITRSDLVSDKAYSNIVVYDIDRYLNAKVISVGNVTKAISSSSKFMVVKSKGMMQDNEGDAVPSIRGWWNGTELAFPVKINDELTAEDVNSLAHGDVIQFTYDENGEIDKIQKYTSLGGSAYYQPTNMYYSFSVIGGVVDECDYSAKRIKLYYTDTNKWIALSSTASPVVTIYDSASKTVTQGSFADIAKNDKIVAKMSYYVVSEIVVVR